MPHVITQACCNDAACTQVCPVDCIHPSPGETGFGSAEMLYIDPATCIDCGSCVVECPVDAIHQDEDLPEHLTHFAQINAEYFRDRSPLGPIPTREVAPLAEASTSRIAVVGAGASGWYAVAELLDRGGVEVDVFDRLPTPWGLVRSGVAPDHQRTKGATRFFAERAQDPRVRVMLNVEVGKDLSVEELLEYYDAVLVAAGASGSRSLGIPGEDLPGSWSATDLVAWYNGHPDHATQDVDVSGQRAVVIGNGNVALDVARILTAGADHLRESDIATHALEALAAGSLTEVVVIARRSAAHAACTAAELLALDELDGVSVSVAPAALDLDAGDTELVRGSVDRRRKYEYLSSRSEWPPKNDGHRITFRFLESPVEILGDERTEAIRLRHNVTGAEMVLPTSLVIRSVGYAGSPFPGLPFDPSTGTIPHDGGRVLDCDTGTSVPGCYVTGWIKRGSTGGIGANKPCAKETVAHLLDDLADGLDRPLRPRTELGDLLRARAVTVVDWDGWRTIDARELADGERSGRPRVKVVDPGSLLTLGRASEGAAS